MAPGGVPPRRLAGAAALVSVVLVAVLLRGHNLGWPPLWTDEAESAINGLTVLAEGVPSDRYLGQPLYENTLVRPWPESPEYEFRDISYSDRGVAVYHGWLPLYAIAAAFRLAGVAPDEARHGTPLRDASTEQIRHWTAVPRWPALAFSALFVLAAYGLGRAIHGPPLGWALALAAATADVFVRFGRQARYYSPTLAGNTACALAIWNACRRGRLRDHVLAGLAVGVVFHVHSLSAVTMAALYVAVLPLARRQPRLWLRVLAAGAVGGVLVLPWAAWSGLLRQAGHIPAAWHYIDVDTMVSSLPSDDPAAWATAAIGLAWFAAAWLLGGRLPERWRRPIVAGTAGVWFATAWLALSYLSFTALAPAASYFAERVKLVVAVPGLLLNALVILAASRAVRPSWRFLPVGGVIVLLVLAGQLPPKLVGDGLDGSFGDLVSLIRARDLAHGARIFATPNEHLILTYYSGRPVQSIGPVRKEWLDRFEEDLLIVEGPLYERPRISEVREMARGFGLELTPAQAHERAGRIPALATALDLLGSGSRVVPAPAAPDALDLALVEAVKRGTKKEMTRQVEGTPLGRFARPANWGEWRRAFFYWFSNPDSRAGTRLNYASCRRSALVTVYANGFVALDCRKEPRLPPGTTVARSAPDPAGPLGAAEATSASARASPQPALSDAGVPGVEAK